MSGISSTFSAAVFGSDVTPGRVPILVGDDLSMAEGGNAVSDIETTSTVSASLINRFERPASWEGCEAEPVGRIMALAPWTGETDLTRSLC